MGEHSRNPIAIAADAPRRIPGPGDVQYAFRQKVELELNKEKLAEVTAILDAAKARGEDPRFSIPNWNPKDTPEFFDYVVYNEPMVGRPSALAIDPKHIPFATIRWSEHLRIPLVDIIARADERFAAAETRGSSH